MSSLRALLPVLCWLVLSTAGLVGPEIEARASIVEIDGETGDQVGAATHTPLVRACGLEPTREVTVHRFEMNRSSFTVSIRAHLDDLPAPRADLNVTIALVGDDRAACRHVNASTNALGQAALVLSTPPRPEPLMIAVTATHPVATVDDQRSVAVIER